MGFDATLLIPITFDDFYYFYYRFVSIVNYFYILSIFAISINAMFRVLWIFYNLRFLFPFVRGTFTFIRSLINGSLIMSGDCLRCWRGTFINYELVVTRKNQ